MHRYLSTLWRWILIAVVYLVLAVPITGLVVPGAGGQALQVPMLFQALLRGAAYGNGYFPDNVYYEEWQAFLSAYAMNCLFVSIALQALWNILYAPNMLGRNHENSARTVIWFFVAIHTALLLVYAFYVFTLAPHIWAWIIRQPVGLNLLLLLPLLLVVPFYLSARGLCPYRIYNVFPLFARLRGRLGLRIYSKRGPR